jgi:hypothetical protein
LDKAVMLCGIALALMAGVRAFCAELEMLMCLMKKSLVLVAVFFGMFVGSARAKEIMSVKVPFPFLVGHTEFPAGEYDVRSSDDAGTVLVIEGTGKGSTRVVFTIPADGADPAGDEGALVFNRTENEYRLAQIWESATMGRALQRSIVPRRAQGQAAAPEPTTVVVAANWK